MDGHLVSPKVFLLGMISSFLIGPWIMLQGQGFVDSIYVINAHTPDTADLTPYTSYFEEPEASENIDEVWQQSFKPISDIEKLRTHHQVLWLRFKLKNNQSDTAFFNLYIGRHQYIVCWMAASKHQFENGRYVPWKRRASHIRSIYLPIKLAPGEQENFLIQVNDFMDVGRRVHVELISREVADTFLGKHFIRQKNESLSSIFIIAVTFFLFCFTLLQYLNFRDKVYLYYSLYLLSMFCQFLKAFEYLGLYQFIFVHLGMANLYLDVLIDTISLFFYAGFVIHFLNLRSESSQTYRQLRLFLAGMGLLVLFNLLLLAIGQYAWANKWFLLAWTAQTIGSFWFMFILYKRLSVPFAFYILLGSAFLLLGGCVSITIAVLKRYTDFQMIYPLLPARIGFLLEVFCFSYTLGLRMRDNEKQKKQVQLDLELNNIALLQAEIKALKAQINPHFISNCLNSIKALIQQKRSEEAIDYLVRFSNLIRSVVDYSLKQEITLRQELTLSKLYLDMEALRLGQRFQYKMDWESSHADLDFFTVPPFILQPFLENAIWHGFRQEDGSPIRQNILTIRVEERETGLCCIIEDNGIGRKKAMQLKTNSSNSVGIHNVEERLLLLNKLQELDLSITIIDLYDDAGHATGTRVELHLLY